MEDKNIKKLNIPAADLPEVPRREDGSIDLEKIQKGKSKRNNVIVPDNIFNAYYRELPDKVENESGTKRTTPTGGVIGIFGGDPEADKVIQKMGADTLNAAKAQRRTFAEIIEESLVKNANSETVEELELTTEIDHLTAIITAAIRRAERGDVKAMEFIRDTIGQKPTEKIDANVNQVTPEQMELLEEFKKIRE